MRESTSYLTASARKALFDIHRNTLVHPHILKTFRKTAVAQPLLSLGHAHSDILFATLASTFALSLLPQRPLRMTETGIVFYFEGAVNSFASKNNWADTVSFTTYRHKLRLFE